MNILLRLAVPCLGLFPLLHSSYFTDTLKDLGLLTPNCQLNTPASGPKALLVSWLEKQSSAMEQTWIASPTLGPGRRHSTLYPLSWRCGRHY